MSGFFGFFRPGPIGYPEHSCKARLKAMDLLDHGRLVFASYHRPAQAALRAG